MNFINLIFYLSYFLNIQQIINLITIIYYFKFTLKHKHYLIDFKFLHFTHFTN